jgi:hypothetical protein
MSRAGAGAGGPLSLVANNARHRALEPQTASDAPKRTPKPPIICMLAIRRRAFGQFVARLQQDAGAAANTLLKVMIDPATPVAGTAVVVARIQ